MSLRMSFCAWTRAVLERCIPGIGRAPMIDMDRPLPGETVPTMAAGALDERLALRMREELTAL